MESEPKDSGAWIPEELERLRRRVAELEALALKRERAEAALRESEERFRNLLEFIPGISIQGYGADGKVRYWNKASEQVYGYTAEEAIGKNLADLIIPDHVKSEFQKALKLGAQATSSGEFMPGGEYLLRHKNGSLVPVHSIHTVVKLEGRDPIMFCIDVDLTERKKIEEELRRTKEHLENVVENAVDAVAVVDSRGRVVSWNKRSEEVFGHSAQEALGMHFSAFYEERSKLEPLLDELRSRGVVRDREMAMRCKDGQVVPMELSISLLKDHEGRRVGSVCMARDLREKKLLEAQLMHAMKMEAVGTLAGGIAHDFNNLLQAVQGYTEWLLFRKQENDPDAQPLQAILRAAKRGGELTRQLLTFSRKLESRRRPTDLNREVLQVRELLERAIPKMITIELDLEDELRIVDIDPSQIEQAIMNLAVNARDAMPQGGLLRISTRNVFLNEKACRGRLGLTPGSYVLLAVSDTGHGMDQKTLQHVFEPFFTTKETGKGTGLGLSMVYGIVKSHGGHVFCESEPGRGTTFQVYLPAPEQGLEVREEPPGFEVRAGREVVLFVDDEDFIRDLGQQILCGCGYRVLLAENGEKALELYRERCQGIDLVVLDLIMPGMGGRHCLQEILKIDPEARVIVSSGYSDHGSVKEALAAGARGFLGKPYEAKEMLQLVRRALEGPAARFPAP